MDKTKIYGIAFDSAQSGGEERMADAAGLQNDYVIGGSFQNGGRNDFDDAYPFGALRLCSVRMVNGEKTVTYENIDRSGKMGNVMVEIPKFYAKREKNGTRERWLISGTCHEGFELEPCFRRGGQALDCVYVGVYNSEDRGDGVFSATGNVPDYDRTIGEFERSYAAAGMDPYDLTIHQALQKLMVIEFGTRFLKKHLGGIEALKYFSRLDAKKMIYETGPNRVSILNEKRGRHFVPGLELGLGHREGDASCRRRVTKTEVNPQHPEWVDIYYDGSDLSDVIHAYEDAAFGIPQRNGLTDGLHYHTGRCDLEAPLAPQMSYLCNPFRYRYIENVWGNVWEYLSGLKVQHLKYYYTTEPERYGAELAAWQCAETAVPEQHHLANFDPHGAIWTSEFGQEAAEPTLLLPKTLVSGKIGALSDGVFYAFKDKNYGEKPVDPDIVYSAVTGGGFDHVFGSAFTYRCTILPATANWLYSDRVCLRK